MAKKQKIEYIVASQHGEVAVTARHYTLDYQNKGDLYVKGAGYWPAGAWFGIRRAPTHF